MDNEEIKTNEPEVLHTYKGVSKDMTAHGGFKYEVGVEYEAKGDIKACSNGFHACEMPLDVFNYFPPASSRYFECEQSGDISKDSDDTKVASRKIKLGAEIGIPGLVKAQIEYVKAHTTTEHSAGWSGVSSAGDSGVSSAGDSGVSSAGDSGVSSAGWSGVSSAGDSGVSSAGDSGVSSAGWSGVSSAGDSGVSSAGNSGVSSAGDSGVSSAGEYGVSSSRGKSKVGQKGVAVARNSADIARVSGGLGALLVIAIEDDYGKLKEWKAGIVDGEVLKPNVWYTLKDGEFVEVEEE